MTEDVTDVLYLKANIHQHYNVLFNSLLYVMENIVVVILAGMSYQIWANLLESNFQNSLI